MAIGLKKSDEYLLFKFLVLFLSFNVSYHFYFKFISIYSIQMSMNVRCRGDRVNTNVVTPMGPTSAPVPPAVA